MRALIGAAARAPRIAGSRALLVFAASASALRRRLADIFKPGSVPS
jgi:hypothetical protein